MTNLQNLIGKVKKQACFRSKKGWDLLDVGTLFLAGLGEKLKNSCFEKAVRDGESREMRIFEVPKLDP